MIHSHDTGESRRRVVITGMGVVAANGTNLKTFWETIRDGKSAISLLSRFDTTNIPSKVAAEIKDFDPTLYMDTKSARRLDRSLQLSVAAARLATQDAGIDFSRVDADRTGVVEGSSLSNNESAWQTKELFLSKGYRAVGMSALINGYAGAGSGEIAQELGVKGHAITCSTTSASGNDAVGYALNMIRSEEVDVMVAGGAEAPLIESVWAIMCLNKAMSRYVDEPTRAMRPFDRTRDGFVLGEGAGYVILEELGHALSRNARIYAEVLAHGRSCEAYHTIAPHPEGIGVRRALEKAIRQAHVLPTNIDYINAHATATEANDLAETRGIKAFFGPHAKHLAVTSTKPVTGHCLAAAGALETIVCALALVHQEVPMTLNLQEPGHECDLDYVKGKSRPYPLQCVVNLNSGFGGKHSCLVLAKLLFRVKAMRLAALIPLVGCVLNFFLALFVLRIGFRQKPTRVYFFWGLAITVWNLGQFFLFTVHDKESALFWARFLWFGVIFIPILLFHLSLLIAQVPVRAYTWALYAFAGALALSNFTDFFIRDVRDLETSGWYAIAGPGLYVFNVLFCLVFVTIAILVRRRKTLPALNRSRLDALIFAQSVLVFLGTNDLLPIIGMDYYPFTHYRVYPYGSSAAVLYGLIVAYSVLQRHLLDIHVQLSRMAAQLIRFLFLFFIGVALLLTATLIAPNEFTPVAVCSAIAALMISGVVVSVFFPRLFGGTGLETWERRILGDRFEYQDQVRSFIESMSWYRDVPSLFDALHDMLTITFRLRSYQIILRDETSRVFALFRSHPDEPIKQLPELRIPSPVFQFFEWGKAEYLSLSRSNPGAHNTLEQQACDQLGNFAAEFCFALSSQNEPFGLLLVGEKISGEPYTATDINLLAALVKSMSLVINQIRLKMQILQAEELDLLGRMSRGVAHDLNNLLTPISTILQLSSEGLPQEAMEDLLPVALRNVKAMRAYIRESLFFSENLRPDFQLGRLDVLVAQAAEVARNSRDKVVDIITETPGEILVEMDEVLIQRMIANLISNAIDASATDAKIRVELVRLIKTEASRDWLRVRIIDKGEGIRKEDLNRVFTPYFTTKNRGDETRGFGLGLAICRKIVNLHGGNLSIASQLKRGTTVQVDLPSRQIKQAAPPVAAQESVEIPMHPATDS